MMTPLQHAYCDGWNFTMHGHDPRYGNPHPKNSDEHYAWDHGALDAFEAEDGEDPQPETAGY